MKPTVEELKKAQKGRELRSVTVQIDLTGLDEGLHEGIFEDPENPQMCLTLIHVNVGEGTWWSSSPKIKVVSYDCVSDVPRVQPKEGT